MVTRGRRTTRAKKQASTESDNESSSSSSITKSIVEERATETVLATPSRRRRRKNVSEAVQLVNDDNEENYVNEPVVPPSSVRRSTRKAKPVITFEPTPKKRKRSDDNEDDEDEQGENNEETEKKPVSKRTRRTRITYTTPLKFDDTMDAVTENGDVDNPLGDKHEDKDPQEDNSGDRGVNLEANEEEVSQNQQLLCATPRRMMIGSTPLVSRAASRPTKRKRRGGKLNLSEEALTDHSETPFEPSESQTTEHVSLEEKEDIDWDTIKPVHAVILSTLENQQRKCDIDACCVMSIQSSMLTCNEFFNMTSNSINLTPIQSIIQRRHRYDLLCGSSSIYPIQACIKHATVCAIEVLNSSATVTYLQATVKQKHIAEKLSNSQYLCKLQAVARYHLFSDFNSSSNVTPLQAVVRLSNRSDSPSHSLSQMQAAIRHSLLSGIVTVGVSNISTMFGSLQSVIRQRIANIRSPEVDKLMILQSNISQTLVPIMDLSKIVVSLQSLLKQRYTHVPLSNTHSLPMIQAAIKQSLVSSYCHFEALSSGVRNIQSCIRQRHQQYGELNLFETISSVLSLQSTMRLRKAPCDEVIPLQLVILQKRNQYYHACSLRSTIALQALTNYRNDVVDYPCIPIVSLQAVVKQTQEVTLSSGLHDITLMQTVIRTMLSTSLHNNHGVCYSQIQKCWRDCIIDGDDIFDRNIEVLQRQLRQSLVVMPGGSMDDRRRRHELILKDKQEIYESFSSQFKKGVNYVWSTISNLTPMKKRARSDDTITPTPIKRRRIDEQFEKRMQELTSPNSPENSEEKEKLLEIERLRADNKLLLELKGDIDTSDQVTPVKKSFMPLTPPESTPRRSILSYINPFSLFSPSNSANLRNEPISSWLTGSATKRIYSSDISQSESDKDRIRQRDSTPYKKRARDELDDDEYTLAAKRLRFTDAEELSTNSPLRATSITWRDGYDRRNHIDDDYPTFLVEDVHDSKFSPHHHLLPAHEVEGILKTKGKKLQKKKMASRPPLFPALAESTQPTASQSSLPKQKQLLDDSVVQ